MRTVDRGDVLRLALGCGLAVGLAEAAARGVQRLGLGQRIYMGGDVVWMAPLTDAVLFLGAGLALAAAGRWRPRLGSVPVATGALVCLGLLGPLLHVPRLHWAASTLLAAGAGVQAARLVEPRAARVAKLSRRVTPWLPALVVILAGGLTGGRLVAESRALAALPPPPPGAPNVLLVVLDTVRAKSLSLHGYERRTSPHLERLAERAVVFDRALSTSSWTLPSHGTMFTGRYPHDLSADWLSPLDGTHPTLAEAFRAHGYLTAGFTGNLLYTPWETGLGRGFVRYEDYPVSAGMVAYSSFLVRTLAPVLGARGSHLLALVSKSADRVNQGFLAWLDRAESGRPFFVFLNYFDAHVPYLVPAPFAERFGPTAPRAAGLPESPRTREEVRIERNAYDGALAWVDHHLGALLDELGRRGVLDHTLLVVTSDHGEQFGEHGLVDHANSLYRPLLHVPLLVAFPPRLPAGVRVAAPVTLRDLPAMILDLAPLPRAPGFPGVSLARYWAAGGEATASASPLLAEVSKTINRPAWWPASRGDMKALVAEGYQYIRNGDGRDELYDFEHDPEEERDLAGVPAHRDMLAALRSRLANIAPSRHPGGSTASLTP